MKFAPAPGTIPLVPVPRAENAHLFLSPELVEPQAVEGSSIATLPLRLGPRVDLLGLSEVADLMESGVQDPTDVIDSCISVAKLYYRSKRVDGIHELSMDGLPGGFFAQIATEHPQVQMTRYTVLIDEYGTPNSLWARLQQSWRKFCGNRPHALIQISGSVNTETGTAELHYRDLGEDRQVDVVGYTLNARRVNLKRKTFDL
jgi:hypothetical protein